MPERIEHDYDLILSNHVLYYVPALKAILDRLIRSLRPGGLFLTSIAGRENALIDLWFRSFELIGRAVPYQTAEDVESVLVRLRSVLGRREVHYHLSFPDTTANRMSILRFLLGEFLDLMPIEDVLDLFSPHAVSGQIKIHTTNRQYLVRSHR